MGFSKAHAFPIDQQALAFCGKIIAHPARIQIIEFLHCNGPSCVQDIAATIPLSEKTITQHLSHLRLCGLLIFEEKTPYIFYDLDKRVLHEIAEIFIRFWEAKRGLQV